MKCFSNTCYFAIISCYTCLVNLSTLLVASVALSIFQEGFQVAVHAQTHSLCAENDPWNG